jgi:hypothetical protein
MSDVSQGPGWWQASDGKWYPPEQSATATAAPPPAPSFAPSPAGYPPAGYPAAGGNNGPLGKRENIGKQILLSIVTLGLYGIYWVYKSHEEIKVHSNQGVGGVVGVVIFLIVGVVTLFLLPSEIKKMYEQDGKESPVGPATAFWILLFGIPWYVKCQNALNDYWASKGVPAPA